MPKSLSDNALNVLPYRALLRAENWEDRKRMVMALYDSGRVEASPVLRQALQDPDERIRLLAAQALERISERSERAIQAERARIAARPEDPQPRLELARLLYERAGRASHSAETERSAYAEAGTHVTAALHGLKEPRLTSARLQLGRIHARLGQADEAIEALEPVPPEALDYPHARYLIAEMRLQKGDVKGCREEIRGLERFPVKNGLKGSVAFWGSRP